MFRKLNFSFHYHHYHLSSRAWALSSCLYLLMNQPALHISVNELTNVGVEKLLVASLALL